MLADICDAPGEAQAYFDTAINQAREIGIRSELAEACAICEQAGMLAQLKRASRLAGVAPGSSSSPA